MFTSFAGVFRTRQAVRDLQEVVHTHRDAVSRLGATGTDQREIVSIARSGGIISDTGTRAYSTILLAAALPDEDYSTFVAATAILLADRLQDGAGEEDLYWNFDAFRDHYTLAGPPVRAALLNGFRLAHEQDRLALPHSPDPDACLTRKRADVLMMLRAGEVNELADMIENDVAPAVAGRAWLETGRNRLTVPEQAGFRYLYERPTSMAPMPEKDAPLLGWV